jgi:hypothetical protein
MQTEQTPYEIFISYSRKDNQPIHPGEPGWVSALRDHILSDHRRFSTEPLAIFFDATEINDMDDWQGRILGALRRSKILLICLSPNYFNSPYCRWEWEAYLTRQVHQLMGSDSVASIYFVQAPGSVTEQNKKWYESVWHGNFTDLRPWFPQGVRALQEQEVQRHMAVLGQSLWERLQRARRAEAAPGNLRRQNPYFVGRSEELRRLHDELSLGAVGVVTALHGLGGQGKTELAVAYGHAWADCYPAGLWLINAEGKKELLPLIGELAYAPELRLVPSDAARADPVLLGREVLAELQRRAQCVRSQDPDQGAAALLIIDNVSDPALLSATQLAILPQADWLRIIATTRLGPENLHRQKHSLALVAVDSLDPADALKLVRDHQPDQIFASAAEEAAVREIVAELGGFTLAIEQAAVYLGLHPEITPSAYLQSLRQKGLTLTDIHGRRREVADEINHREKQLDLILHTTLAMLEPAGHTALAFAALLPSDYIAWPWLQALTMARHPELKQNDPAEPDPWISLRRQLEGLRLLTPGDQSEISRLHRLVAAHVRQKSTDQGQADALGQALAKYLTERTDVLYDYDGKPADWELDALLITLPVILQTGNELHSLAYGALFFTDKIVIYRTLAAARAVLECTHAILATDAGADPSNSSWQRDLSVSYDRVGDVFRSQGDLASALKAYQNSLAIREKLAGADPSNSSWQRDLSVSFNKVGDVFSSQGDLASALKAYQNSLAIREKLAGADPSNSSWQRDLVVSYYKLASFAEQTNSGDATIYWQKCLVVLRRMRDHHMFMDPPVAKLFQQLENQYGK